MLVGSEYRVHATMPWTCRDAHAKFADGMFHARACACIRTHMTSTKHSRSRSESRESRFFFLMLRLFFRAVGSTRSNRFGSLVTETNKTLNHRQESDISRETCTRIVGKAYRTHECAHGSQIGRKLAVNPCLVCFYAIIRVAGLLLHPGFRTGTWIWDGAEERGGLDDVFFVITLREEVHCIRGWCRTTPHEGTE